MAVRRGGRERPSVHQGGGMRGEGSWEQLSVRARGQTKTDNGPIAKGMVKRQRGTHTGTSRREDRHTTYRHKQRELRDGRRPKQKGRRQKPCRKQDPMHGWGGSAKRQNFRYQPQTGAEGRIKESPQAHGPASRATQPANTVAWKQQTCLHSE